MGKQNDQWPPPHHTTWVTYRHQLWPGWRYGLSTMTNDIKLAAKLLDNVKYRTVNIFDILRNVTKGPRKIHTMFGGFRMFDLPTEQLISRVNIFFQHYHVSTNSATNMRLHLDISNCRLAPHTICSLRTTPNGVN
jgi:hypothetical protein